VHAAGTDHHQQAVVVAIEDRLHLGAVAQDRVLAILAQWQVLEDLRRRHQLDDPLDPAVPYAVGLLSR
jgi:hypothetical protein